MAADAGTAVAGDCGDLAVVDGNGSFAAKAADTGAAVAGDGIHLAAVDSDIGRAGDHADAGHTAGDGFNTAVAGDLDRGGAVAAADANACGAGGRGDMAVIDGNVGVAAVAADARIAAGDGAHVALVGDADIGVGAAADTGHTAQRREDLAVDDLDGRALVRACITSANAGAAAAAGSLFDGGVLDGHSAVITAADAGIICSLGNDGRTALNGHLAVAACTHADAAAALASHSAVFDFYGSSAAVCSADACTAITAGGIYGAVFNGHIGIAVAAAANTGTIITTGGGNIAAVFDGNGSIAAADTGTGTFSVFNSHIVQCNIGGFATHAGTNTSTAAIAGDLFNLGILDFDLRGLTAGTSTNTAAATATGYRANRCIRDFDISVAASATADACSSNEIATGGLLDRAAGDGDITIIFITTADAGAFHSTCCFFDDTASNSNITGATITAAADTGANIATLGGNTAVFDGDIAVSANASANACAYITGTAYRTAVDRNIASAAIAAADAGTLTGIVSFTGDFAAVNDDVAAVLTKDAADAGAPGAAHCMERTIVVSIIDIQCAVFLAVQIFCVELQTSRSGCIGLIDVTAILTLQVVVTFQLNVGGAFTVYGHS